MSTTVAAVSANFTRDLDQNYEHEERWSDASWDWCVANTGTADLNAQIRRQVSQPRPEGT